MAQVNSPGVLQCSAYTWLWVSWLGGVVSGGLGQVVGANTTIIYSDPSLDPIYNITHLGYSSSTQYPSYWNFSGCLFPLRTYWRGGGEFAPPGSPLSIFWWRIVQK